MTVIDASVIASKVLPDEVSAASDVTADRIAESSRIVPPIFRYEITNVVLAAVRRQRLDAHRAGHVLAEVSAMRLDVVERGQEPLRLLGLGLEHGITSYDAAYLSLALTTGEPLATLDGRLGAVAERLGVALA